MIDTSKVIEKLNYYLDNEDGKTKLEAVYNACIKLIEWFNVKLISQEF